MKTKVAFLSVSLIFNCFASIVNAQQSTFTRVYYDLSGAAQGYSVLKTFDRNYLIAGEKDNRALVMKVDTAGNILWNKIIGSFNDTRFNAMTGTSDSCIVLAGYTPDTSNGGYDIFCVKITLAGDTLWTRAVEMGQSAVAISVQQTSDHGVILAGHLDQDFPPYSRIVVVKLDASGNLLWGKILSIGNESNYASSIKQTMDGGYIVTGEMDLYSPFEAAGCILKLTPSGDISWAKKMVPGTATYASGMDVNVTNTGFLCLVSSEVSGAGTMILKTDLSGNFLWGQAFGSYSAGIDNGLPRPKLHPTSDGGYVFTTSNGWIFGSIIKIDSVGNYQWGQELTLISSDIAESYDKGYLALGNGPIWGVILAPTDHPQIGIIKTDSSGNSSDCVLPNFFNSGPCLASLTTVTSTNTTGGTLTRSHPAVTGTELAIFDGCITVTGSIADNKPDGFPFHVSPNPSNGLIQITRDQPCRQPLLNPEIYNVMGEKIYGSYKPVADKLQVDLSNQPDGIYFIQVLYRGERCSQKVLIHH